MRYSGDDYCYASAMADHGLFGNQLESYFHVAKYNGNRYSLTLLSNLADLLGAKSGAIMPVLAIVLLVAGAFFLLRDLGKLFNGRIGIWIVCQAAIFLIFICLYQAPDLIQDLFWRSAMIAYLVPIISLIWLMFLIAHFIGSERRMTTGLAGIAILAIFSAGFSETGAALQAAVLVCGLAGVLLFWKNNIDHSQRALPAIGVGLVVTLLGILIMLISPSNANRIGDYAHPDLVHFIMLSVSFGLTFMIETFKSYPLPTLVTLAFCTTLAFALPDRPSPGKIKFSKWLLAGCLIVLVSLCLVISTATPSVLARNTYPEQRAWMPGQFALTIGVASLGFLFGAFLRQHIKNNLIKQAILLVAMLAVAAYAVRTVPRIYRDAQPLQSWARAWDIRDRYIRAEVEAGDRNIIVNSLPTIIPYVTELQEDPGHWYNLCAADWYGIDSISAINTP